jgi:putative endonuclease
MAIEMQPTVYIMANGRNGTLYIGVTSDPIKRSWEHKEGISGGFTTKYGCKQLVWYESHATMANAIHREKRLKKYTRDQKIKLIEILNPQWRDLFEDIL